MPFRTKGNPGATLKSGKKDTLSGTNGLNGLPRCLGDENGEEYLGIAFADSEKYVQLGRPGKLARGRRDIY